MSGLGRALADLELRNAATMRAAQAEYDSRMPDDTQAHDELLGEVDAIVEHATELMARAVRALEGKDLEAARDLLIEAGRWLVEDAESL